MPELSAAGWLQAYGFNQTDPDGALVRMKHGRVFEKFVPVEGGFHLYRVEEGVWVKKAHHVVQAENGGHDPVWVWSPEEIVRIYRPAVEARQAEG